LKKEQNALQPTSSLASGGVPPRGQLSGNLEVCRSTENFDLINVIEDERD
jgi:hypothetical protein